MLMRVRHYAMAHTIGVAMREASLRGRLHVIRCLACDLASPPAVLARRVAPGGRAVAVDLDLSLVDADVSGLEFRQADILAWSREQGIDYFIGRRLLEMLSRLGLEDVGATAETAHYNGGSAWAVYWRQTVAELRTRLVTSGKLDDRSIDTFLAWCADPAWWTQTIAFTAAAGRVRGE